MPVNLVDTQSGNILFSCRWVSGLSPRAQTVYESWGADVIQAKCMLLPCRLLWCRRCCKNVKSCTVVSIVRSAVHTVCKYLLFPGAASTLGFGAICVALRWLTRSPVTAQRCTAWPGLAQKPTASPGLTAFLSRHQCRAHAEEPYAVATMRAVSSRYWHVVALSGLTPSPLGLTSPRALFCDSWPMHGTSSPTHHARRCPVSTANQLRPRVRHPTGCDSLCSRLCVYFHGFSKLPGATARDETVQMQLS